MQEVIAFPVKISILKGQLYQLELLKKNYIVTIFLSYSVQSITLVNDVQHIARSSYYRAEWFVTKYLNSKVFTSDYIHQILYFRKKKYREEKTSLAVDLCFQHYISSSAFFVWKIRMKSFSSSKVSKESVSDELTLAMLFEDRDSNSQNRISAYSTFYISFQQVCQSIISGISLLLTAQEELTNNSTRIQFGWQSFVYSVIYRVFSLMSSSTLNSYKRYQAVQFLSTSATVNLQQSEVQ